MTSELKGQETAAFRPGLFDGKKVLVSGATSGIGLAIAQGFASLGAQVTATGSSTTKIAALREDATLKGIRFEQLDVRDNDAIKSFVGCKSRHGHNRAGRQHHHQETRSAHRTPP